MPFNFPSDRKEVSERIKTDVRRELPTSNPFLKNSFLSAMIVGLAGRVFDFFIQLEVLTKQMFPDTATGTFLERWGSYRDITRDPATISEGKVVATGTPSSTIAAGLALLSSDGLEYTTVGSTSVAAVSGAITSITREGQVATVITTEEHNLGSGVSATISGVSPIAYNGEFSITVTGLSTFTYTVEGSPATPASGPMIVTTNSATVNVESDGFGQETNQDAGVILTFSGTIAGVASDTTVLFSEITGGTDIQSDEAYRAEVIDAYKNPTSTFNVAAIEKKMKEVAGVTRVWVEQITPAVGQVTVYFTRDGDESPIPDSGEVTAAKNKLLEIKPANTSDDDVIVAAPIAVPTTFTFSASGGLIPNTETMKTAVTANLEAFFSDSVTVGENVPQIGYESAIYNTIDPDTGSTVTSFSLDSPPGDITIASGELPTLGSVTYL